MYHASGDRGRTGLSHGRVWDGSNDRDGLEKQDRTSREWSGVEAALERGACIERGGGHGRSASSPSKRRKHESRTADSQHT